MAEVVITTRVNNELVQKTVDTFSGLKKEIRNAKDELLKFAEGSEDFKRVQGNISKLQTSIKDLGDTAKIQGSGVERLQQSFNLLNESFLTGDLDKAKVAFTGIGQAMGAIPIFLLIEGIQLLIQNFDEVIKIAESFTESAQKNEKAIRNLNSAYGEVAENINEISFLQEKLIKNSDYITKIELENAKQRGASSKELNKIEQEGNEKKLSILQKAQENYRKQLEFTDAQYLNATKTGNEDLIKNAKETYNNALSAFKKAKQETEDFSREIDIKAEERETELYEKRKEANNKFNKDSLNSTLKRLELEEKLFYNKIGAERKAEQDAAAEREKERLAAEKAYLDKQAELDKQFADLAKDQRQKDLEDEIAKNKKAVDDKKKSEDAKKQAVTVGLNAAATLTAAFFAFQLNGAKGNAKEELRIRKQMFEVDKAFNVARAIQDGIRSVQAALTIPPPGGQILAGVNAGLAAANVAKILATKFDGGTSGGDASGGGISTGGGGAIPNTSASVPAAPQFNQTTLNGGTNDQTINNQQLTVRAYVVESEISQSQKIVERIKRTSKFG